MAITLSTPIQITIQDQAVAAAVRWKLLFLSQLPSFSLRLSDLAVITHARISEVLLDITLTVTSQPVLTTVSTFLTMMLSITVDITGVITEVTTAVTMEVTIIDVNLLIINSDM
jgi:hypothetical protein